MSVKYLWKPAEEGLAVDRESQMVERAKSGDTQAFGEILDAYKGFLFAVILPVVRDPVAAEDVLQETFLKIYLSLPEFKGGNLRAWMARIAVNKAIDWRRRNARLRLLESPADIPDGAGWYRRQGLAVPHDPERYVPELSGAARTADCPSAEDEFMRQLGMEWIAGAVRALPPVYRRTFLLYYAGGYDYESIAGREGVSVKTVESRLYRARKMLREALRRYDSEFPQDE
ncbi:MAG: sigma-70 family RNA polymerase sigma factor [Firmicutes bacterium]|nr:sigma-70 family RNA polymerase sigma factor [Candidatus Fermentithermobacillaceae bacterium]